MVVITITFAALALLLVLPLPTSGAPVAPEKVDLWLTWLARSEDALSRIDGYTVIYHKKEQVTPKLLTDDKMRLKFRKPFSVYLEWENPDGKGGEAIYIEGQNKNRVRLHPGGFWGMLNFNLLPSSKWIMKVNRHPLSDLGMHRMVEIVGDNVRRAIALGEFVSIDLGQAMMYGRPTYVYEGLMTSAPTKGYYCRRAIVNVDIELGLPLHIRNFDHNDVLVEEYGFEDFKPDVSLTAIDFDPTNPLYRF